MSELTKEEFSVIYKEKFQPVLEDLEKSRIEMNKKIRQCYMPMKKLGVLALIGFVGALVLPWHNFIYRTAPFFVDMIKFVVGSVCFLLFNTCLLGVVGFGIYSSILKSKLRKKLKNEVFIKVLSLFDNINFSDNSNLILAQEIKNMGLFPDFSSKCDDDIITGIHKGCSYIIDECSLMSDSSSQTTYFSGLIVKIQMNKAFTGKTIVGVDEYIQRQYGYDEVQLEDINFATSMKVYSTDQIEARYLLTPSLMERLYALKEVFTDSRTVTAVTSYKTLKMRDALCQDFVSAAFIDGNIYLFIPTKEDFFEIDMDTSLLNEDKYFDICRQIQLILSIIDYFKFDLKLGL